MNNDKKIAGFVDQASLAPLKLLTDTQASGYTKLLNEASSLITLNSLFQQEFKFPSWQLGKEGLVR